MEGVEIYNGDKKVVAQGNFIVDKQNTLSILLFKGQSEELSVVFEFTLVEDTDDKEVISLSQISNNSVLFTIQAPIGKSLRLTNNRPFAVSARHDVYGNFKVSVTRRSTLEFGYVFMIKEHKKKSVAKAKSSNKVKADGDEKN